MPPNAKKRQKRSCSRVGDHCGMLSLKMPDKAMLKPLLLEATQGYCTWISPFLCTLYIIYMPRLGQEMELQREREVRDPYLKIKKDFSDVKVKKLGLCGIRTSG